MGVESDRIEKQIVLRASRQRVWRAISDSKEFGAWFGMRFTEPFAPGAVMKGVMTPTSADPEVAALQKDFEGFPFSITIERIEPERLFSFRWHPNAIERGRDYSNEPTTLIVFELEEVSGGVLLKVTESGFSKIPLDRRAQAFTSNDQGWSFVVKLVEKHLAQHP